MTWGALFERAPAGISPADVSESLAERRAGEPETAEDRETAAEESSDRESTGGEE